MIPKFNMDSNDSMPYGLDFKIPSINENSELNPLRMFMHKNLSKQQASVEKQPLRSTPPFQRQPRNNAISGIKSKRDRKKLKRDAIAQKLEFKQNSREFWSLMGLVDMDFIDKRFENSGIKKIWGETKYSDPCL